MTTTQAEWVSGCRQRVARHEWPCYGNGGNRHAPECPRLIRYGETYIERAGASVYRSGTRHSLSCARAFLLEPESERVRQEDLARALEIVRRHKQLAELWLCGLNQAAGPGSPPGARLLLRQHLAGFDHVLRVLKKAR